MLLAVFEAVKSAIFSSVSLEPGTAEFNEALDLLLRGYPLNATKLKNMWKEAIRMLSISNTQTALAHAVALSLTPEFIFLIPDYHVPFNAAVAA